MLKFWDKYSLSNNQMQSDLWRDKRFAALYDNRALLRRQLITFLQLLRK